MALLVDEEILRLEVAVEHVLHVAVPDHADDLHHDEAHLSAQVRGHRPGLSKGGKEGSISALRKTGIAQIQLIQS